MLIEDFRERDSTWVDLVLVNLGSGGSNSSLGLSQSWMDFSFKAAIFAINSLVLLALESFEKG